MNELSLEITGTSLILSIPLNDLSVMTLFVGAQSPLIIAENPQGQRLLFVLILNKRPTSNSLRP